MKRYYHNMEKPSKNEIRELLDRIARINSSQSWSGDINPTQHAALSYLARANRFSRAPSQVAEYLSATRGTVSQTLKALARKGLIVEQKSQSDKRSISYEITRPGLATLNANANRHSQADLLSKHDMDSLQASLRKLVKRMLKGRGGRSFGVCLSCRHHQTKKPKAYCSLLNVALKAEETHHICHEHEAAS